MKPDWKSAEIFLHDEDGTAFLFNRRRHNLWSELESWNGWVCGVKYELTVPHCQRNSVEWGSNHCWF